MDVKDITANYFNISDIRLYVLSGTYDYAGAGRVSTANGPMGIFEEELSELGTNRIMYARGIHWYTFPVRRSPLVTL